MVFVCKQTDYLVCVLTVKPGHAHDVDVFTNDSDAYVTFNSPRPGKTLMYNVSVNCAEDGSHEVNFSVDVMYNIIV